MEPHLSHNDDIGDTNSSDGSNSDDTKQCQCITQGRAKTKVVRRESGGYGNQVPDQTWS